ncbi:MAG TPA: relaxase/mobilization nuclease domain-containing protein [Pseudonocardiaceae bacterium]
MIAKVVRGWRPAGLIVYLFGPGKYEEHRNPRVVASWDGTPWLHQPPGLASVELDGEVLPAGEFDLDLRRLIATMQDPAVLAGLPLTAPPPVSAEWLPYLRSGGRLPAGAPQWLPHYRYDAHADAVVRRPGYVWHCPVRLHPDDPTLTDEQWQTIAERLMRATGIDQAGCRWIAVRHADDHIHLMATLVSETSGRRFHPYRDYLKLRRECQAIERELGLVRTADADKTATRTPTRAEKGKAERLGHTITAREELHRRVAHAAATTATADDFLNELRNEGLRPHLARDPGGAIRGYSVALPGDVTRLGEPVRYSGGQLGHDLTWPKLLQRWAQVPTDSRLHRRTGSRATPAERRETYRDAARLVNVATTAVRSGDDVDGIAHATNDLLAALSHSIDGYDHGPTTHAFIQFDRAARTPHRAVPTDIGALAQRLRRTSRHLGHIGRITGRGNEKFAVSTLTIAVAGLLVEIAAWQQLKARDHQSRAARNAGVTLGRRPQTTRTEQAPTSGRRPATPWQGRPSRRTP